MTSIHEMLSEAHRHHQAGRLQEAEALYRQILQVQPNHPDALHLLGLIAYQVGQHDMAVRYISQAIVCNPKAAGFHNTIGEAYRAQGKLEEAAVHYRQAIAIKPACVEAYNNLGLVLHAQGKLEESVAQFRHVLALKPTVAEAHNNLGNVLKEQGKLDKAGACYLQALALKPTYAEARNNLGVVLRLQGKLEEAMAHFQQVLALKPNLAEVYDNLAGALNAQGKQEEAVAFYRRALTLKPGLSRSHSNLLLVMSYDPAAGPATIFAEYRKWNDTHARSLTPAIRTHQNNRDSERRLRIGYVSGDFCNHPIGYWIEPLLAAHHRSDMEIVCYSAGAKSDTTTKRLKTLADGWRAIAGMNDEDAAALISADRIDILVDLSGHTAGNRLLVFARKPVPIQATYLGSLTTTGLSTMDYKLTDCFLSPLESREQFTEELIRLPGCFACYKPPPEAPNVTPLPSSRTGSVTFSSFNNPAKVTPQVVAVWSEILHATAPESRLILKYRAFVDPGVQARYRKLFEGYGIETSRLELLPETTFPGHLALYERVDIALDPFPYNGCYTSSEALWMGIPIITLAGNMSYSRYGVTLLANLGLEEFIAATPEEYVAKAVGLAKNRDRLSVLRSELRVRMASSPVCDASALAQAIENAYRLMWRRWCKSQK